MKAKLSVANRYLPDAKMRERDGAQVRGHVLSHREHPCTLPEHHSWREQGENDCGPRKRPEVVSCRHVTPGPALS